jgi:UDP-N-acetylmuramoylalanine--D-glutamate ligase
MISNKNIAIVGFGKEGFSAAKHLISSNDISVFDDKNENEIQSDYQGLSKNKNIKFFLGKKMPSVVGKFDLVVRSPGVQPHNSLVLSLLQNKAILTSPTNIFFEECPSQIIGITGTKGKGTTSTLIYEILKPNFKEVFLAGNIGMPMLDILPKLSKESKVVLELSSFQLIDLKKSPHVAVVLMVTSEHLDWHSNRQEYWQAKKNIVKFQTKNDYTVANKDFPTTEEIAKSSKGKVLFFSTHKNVNGVYVKDNKIISGITKGETICSVADVVIPGKHNLQNVCAAFTVAKIFGIENNKIKKVLINFKGLEHRLQLVRTLNNVKFYNDSFSTTPETTIAAIESFTQPKVLIIGGSTKKSDFSNLISKIISDTTIKKIILIGNEGEKINTLLRKESCNKMLLSEAKTMEAIVKEAWHFSTIGDVVILSPGCASFDMFKNYKDRGLQFIKSVNSL